jgi:hypothetical protein
MRPGYHDLGPANIELDTAFQALGLEYERTSSEFLATVAATLTTDTGTALITISLVQNAIEELKGHFDDKSCRYNRRSVQLIVQRLRAGEDSFWSQVWHNRDLYIKTPGQFKEWKRSPDSPNLSAFIRDHAKPLEPDELDEDKFNLIEYFLIK